MQAEEKRFWLPVEYGAAVRKKAPLEWWVYFGDFNAGEIKRYNIFAHGGFWKDLVKCAKERKNDYEGFCEFVYFHLQYYFWSKCEYEVVISHFPHHDRHKDRKVDIFEQVLMNWDRFIEYVWENRGKIK